MPEAGRIISHPIGLAGNEGGVRIAPVVTLVDAVQPEEVGRRARGGGRVLVVPSGSGDIVAQGGQGSPTEVHLLGYDVMVDQ